ncbi:MAG TPA: DUF72 domain-containing protein [Chitinispirillaceae bacterium]|nr:DUF72 domain-containing protein [Chitinispirillaceae bacterium]
MNKSRILVGTSGYSYKDWIGVLYPPGTRSNDFLRVYAKEFHISELNFTYYRMPQPDLVKRLAAQTGPDFLFSIKAHITLTHEKRPDLSSLSSLFLKGIEPIIESGKLASVLLQFPYSFYYNKENRNYLDKLCVQLGTVPLAVEFRNSYWQKESVYNGLAERDIAVVNVDEPDLPGLLKQSDIVTSKIGYIRFHGRNQTNWWKGDNVTRYDYLYTDSELREWIPGIQTIAAQASLVLIVFNNHSKGQAVQNARRLKEILLQSHVQPV